MIRLFEPARAATPRPRPTRCSTYPCRSSAPTSPRPRRGARAPRRPRPHPRRQPPLAGRRPSPHEPLEPMLAGMEEVGTGLLDRLDAMQRVAASAPGGPLLIVAGPGTGKTRTLTHRIAYLCAELGVYPEQCLAITFTRRAAEELRHRLDGLLGAGRRRRHRRHVPRARPGDPARARRGARAVAGLPDRRGGDRIAALIEARRGGRRARGPPAARGRHRRRSSRRGTSRRCAPGTWSTSTSWSRCRWRCCRVDRRWSTRYRDAVAVDLRRRVPGRRRGAVRAAAAALPAGRQPVRDRRPGPGDLLVPRRRRRVLPALRARLHRRPRRSG